MNYDPLSYWNARKNPNKSDRAPGWLLKYAAPHTAGQARVLELGPGVGRTLDIYSPGQEVTTLDLSRQYAETLADRAKERGITLSQHFLDDPAAPFPFPDAAFEVGVCLQVLMHVPPQFIEHSMGELARVCRRAAIVAGVNEAWNSKAAHCFNHDYLRICGTIGARASEAFVQKDSICFVLARHDGRDI